MIHCCSNCTYYDSDTKQCAVWKTKREPDDHCSQWED